MKKKLILFQQEKNQYFLKIEIKIEESIIAHLYIHFQLLPLTPKMLGCRFM